MHSDGCAEVVRLDKTPTGCLRGLV